MFVVYRILGWHFSFDTLKISLYCALALIKVGSHPYLCSSLCIVVSSPPSPCLPLQLIFYLSLVLFNNLIVMYPDVTFFVFHLWLLGLLMFSGLEYLSNLDIFQPLRPQIFFFFFGLLPHCWIPTIYILDCLELSHYSGVLLKLSSHFFTSCILSELISFSCGV